MANWAKTKGWIIGWDTTEGIPDVYEYTYSHLRGCRKEVNNGLTSLTRRYQ